MTPSCHLPTAPAADATLALLWERIRRQGDMPGFTQAPSTPSWRSMRGEDEREFSMTQTVLSDPVLTQKVLRLANSGMYSAFGQRINTVSKAVLVLGTEAIGHLALGLKLIEELSKSTPDSALAHVEMSQGQCSPDRGAAESRRAPPRAIQKSSGTSILNSLRRIIVDST